MINPRNRAVAKVGTLEAKHKAKLFASGSNHIKLAIADGYYIEAICLIESWIGDRLESYLSYIKGESYAFKVLGTLISEFRKSKNLKIDQELKTIVVEEVEKWKNSRNSAVHNMMRIEEGDWKSWEVRLDVSHVTAVEGFKLFRKINNLVTKLRKRAQREKEG